MINIYKDHNGHIVNTNSIENNCWIDLVNPSFAELNRISNVFKNVPEEFFTDPLDIDEKPRIEFDEDSLLVIFRIPVLNSKDSSDCAYNTIPFGVVILNNNIITISSTKLNCLNIFTDNMKYVSLKNKKHFLFSILLEIASLYLKYLRKINDRIFKYENKLNKSFSNDELLQLMSIEKSLVYFTTSLRTNELIVSKLSVLKSFISGLSEYDIDILEDVVIEFKQNTEMTNILSNILERIMHTSNSIMSNRLNTTMKIFTSLNVIILSVFFAFVVNVFFVDKFFDNLQYFNKLFLMFGTIFVFISVAVFIVFKFFGNKK